jgi:hypothetical protein
MITGSLCAFLLNRAGLCKTIKIGLKIRRPQGRLSRRHQDLFYRRSLAIASQEQNVVGLSAGVVRNLRFLQGRNQ